MSADQYRNKAHQRAYRDGERACMEGRERVPPYGAESRSSLYFRRAWLAGFDAVWERIPEPPDDDPPGFVEFPHGEFPFN